MAGIEYTLVDLSYQPNEAENQLLLENPPLEKEDWSKSIYNSVKGEIKKSLYRNQHGRCAYCRKELEIRGRYEHIDHIVPKNSKPKWLLEPKNLVLSCPSCNGDKRATETLNDDFLSLEGFPNTTDAFKIINPHYDIWQEHLMFEDDIFIVPLPNSKGKRTIEICHLYRFQVIVNRARELKLSQKKPIEKVLHRLSNNIGMSNEHKEELFQVINEYKNIMNENPNFQ